MESAPQHQVPGGDERRLVEKARSDPRAFGELYRAHYPAIAGYLLRRTGDHHTAEDLAGETFMRAYRAFHRFRDQGAGVRPWLYRVASNTANRWARRRSRLRLTATLPETTSPPSPSPAPDVEAAHLALLDVAPRHQTVLVLHYVEGLTIAEVAVALDTRIGTIKSSLARARAEYAKALARRITAHD